jgi:recombination protein RecA
VGGRGLEDRAGLPLGVGPLDELLPDGGLLRGGVTEIAVAGTALGTSLALSACRAAETEARRAGGEVPWNAFIDPSSSLFAPGVARAQVSLERLLVVRPPLEAIGRVAVRLVGSQAFAVTIIDTVGVPGASLAVELGSWPRIVRRLSMALDGSKAVVLLLTDLKAPRPLPLPVAARLELTRFELDRLVVRVAKDRHGRVSAPRSIAWAGSTVGGLAAPAEDRKLESERPGAAPGAQELGAHEPVKLGGACA